MIKNKKIFILGFGKSGISSAKLLSKDNEILITDINSKGKEMLENLNVSVVVCDNQKDYLDESFDYVVKNPAISDNHEVVKKARKLNIPVLTELEVGYRYLPKDVKIIGITGSNGKTTTTTVIYNFLKEAHLPVHLAGNIGIPLCSIIDDIKKGDILVLEVSSHQLVNLDKFKADISVLTNLSEVHLDMFGTYENYKNNKMGIFKNQNKDDISILNMDDKDVFSMTKDIKPKKLYFSSSFKSDSYIKDNYIYYKNEKVISLDDVRVKGIHNYENIMASILAVKEFNVSNEIIKEVLTKFVGVEHRIEFVKKINGRTFYNDSKATNVKSTIIALKSFDSDVVLILGGLDRGHSFDELLPFLGNTKHIVCYGETKNRIKDFALKNNIDVIVTDNLKEAVHTAYNISSENSVILLSPACASWDQYNSFEERGNEFKRIVEYDIID